jgi:formamidopyrimidine-DNA glycosylase
MLLLGSLATVVGDNLRMPELPEMQALAERLDDAVGGGTLGEISPLQFSAMKTFEPPSEAFTGRVLESIGRRGKYLVMDFGGPRILVHLSQGGRVDVEDPPKRTKPKGSVVRFFFDGKPSILIKEFGTQRKAGWWTLGVGDDGPLERLGPDPFSEGFEQLIRTSDDGRRVHTILRDQRTLSGIGRGYSDDILHRAHISPYDSLKKLDASKREALIEATHDVLEHALTEERKRTGGLPTKVDNRFVIHGRHGYPCPRCGADLRRVSYEGYEVTYCPDCQTKGKVLADRRMSRLIK